MGNTAGCPPSAWANARNFALWQEHGPEELVRVFFRDPDEYAQLTLAEALQPVHEDGGSGTLLQHAIAPILNAAHESREYIFKPRGSAALYASWARCRSWCNVSALAKVAPR